CEERRGARQLLPKRRRESAFSGHASATRTVTLLSPDVNSNARPMLILATKALFGADPNGRASENRIPLFCTRPLSGRQSERPTGKALDNRGFRRPHRADFPLGIHQEGNP